MEKLTYMPSQGTLRYTSDFNPAIGDTIGGIFTSRHLT
jgi:hypothetical protein